MQKTSNKEVYKIVQKVKNANNIFIPERRTFDINEQTRNKLNMLIDDQKAIIKSVEVEDYHSGPLTNRNDPNGEKLWVFKKYVEEYKERFYIKLSYLESCNVVMALSCHIDNDQPDND